MTIYKINLYFERIRVLQTPFSKIYASYLEKKRNVLSPPKTYFYEMNQLFCYGINIYVQYMSKASMKLVY